MLKPLLVIAGLVVAPVSLAQSSGGGASPGAACPAGTAFATIRHNKIKPGKWPVFEQAVSAHNAWYAGHRNGTRTTLVRVLTRAPAGPELSSAEAVTITRYADAQPPANDAGRSAFTAQYRDSSDVIDEARVCLRR